MKAEIQLLLVNSFHDIRLWSRNNMSDEEKRGSGPGGINADAG